MDCSVGWSKTRVCASSWSRTVLTCVEKSVAAMESRPTDIKGESVGTFVPMISVAMQASSWSRLSRERVRWVLIAGLGLEIVCGLFYLCWKSLLMERGSTGLDRPGLVRAISWKHIRDLRVKPCLQTGGGLVGFVLHYGRACDCRGLQSRNAMRLFKYA